MTTQTKPSAERLALLDAVRWPEEGNEWDQWRARIYNQMVLQFGNPGLAPLEQFVRRSAKERRCVECGAPGTVEHESVLIASVKSYFMCQGCDDYYRHKHA